MDKAGRHTIDAYNTAILVELMQHTMSLCIGRVYTGCPCCADDLALMSFSENELQFMTNVVSKHSKQNRVTINYDASWNM